MATLQDVALMRVVAQGLAGPPFPDAAGAVRAYSARPAWSCASSVPGVVPDGRRAMTWSASSAPTFAGSTPTQIGECMSPNQNRADHPEGGQGEGKCARLRYGDGTSREARHQPASISRAGQGGDAGVID